MLFLSYDYSHWQHEESRAYERFSDPFLPHGAQWVQWSITLRMENVHIWHFPQNVQPHQCKWSQCIHKETSCFENCHWLFQATIDVLKIDIEYSEWESLNAMIKEGSLQNVKQLVFEIHTKELHIGGAPSKTKDYIHYWKTLTALERWGFWRWKSHPNPSGRYRSQRTNRIGHCCFELYYINVKYMDTNRWCVISDGAVRVVKCVINAMYSCMHCLFCSQFTVNYIMCLEYPDKYQAWIDS